MTKRKRMWTKVTAAKALAALGSAFTMGTREVVLRVHRYEEGWTVAVVRRPRRGKQTVIGSSECPFENLEDAINSALADVGGWQPKLHGDEVEFDD